MINLNFRKRFVSFILRESFFSISLVSYPLLSKLKYPFNRSMLYVIVLFVVFVNRASFFALNYIVIKKFHIINNNTNLNNLIL
jgi:hypothetical protein